MLIPLIKEKNSLSAISSYEMSPLVSSAGWFRLVTGALRVGKQLRGAITTWANLQNVGKKVAGKEAGGGKFWLYRDMSAETRVNSDL